MKSASSSAAILARDTYLCLAFDREFRSPNWGFYLYLIPSGLTSRPHRCTRAQRPVHWPLLCAFALPPSCGSSCPLCPTPQCHMARRGHCCDTLGTELRAKLPQGLFPLPNDLCIAESKLHEMPGRGKGTEGNAVLCRNWRPGQFRVRRNLQYPTALGLPGVPIGVSSF